MSPTLPTQLYTAMLYTATTLVLVVQHIWYNAAERRRLRGDAGKADDRGEGGSDDLAQPLMHDAGGGAADEEGGGRNIHNAGSSRRESMDGGGRGGGSSAVAAVVLGVTPSSARTLVLGSWSMGGGVGGSRRSSVNASRSHGWQSPPRVDGDVSTDHNGDGGGRSSIMNAKPLLANEKL